MNKSSIRRTVVHFEVEMDVSLLLEAQCTTPHEKAMQHGVVFLIIFFFFFLTSHLSTIPGDSFRSVLTTE